VAITWKTREVRRLNDLHFFDAARHRPAAAAALPAAGARRAQARPYRTVTTAIRPLRASMAMRRVLRRFALGKRANYYLKGT